MFMFGGVLLIISVIVALYAFGVITTPYVGTYRMVFYFLLALIAITVIVGIFQSSQFGGYDPTPRGR